MLKKKELQDMFEFLSMSLSDKVKRQILAVTGRGNQSAARDYIQANALLTEWYKANPSKNISAIEDERQLWDMLDPAVKFRLKSYTPCLAARYDELKPEQQRSLFEDKNWVATEKMNGVRGWLINFHGKTHLFSRNYSDKDCGLLEYWNNIYQDSEYDGVYAIDVEVKFEPGVDIRPELQELGLETDSPLEAMVALLHTYPKDAIEIQRKYMEKYGHDLICFRLIAPLYFNGKNYLKRNLGEGMDDYNKVVEFGKSIGYNVKPISRCSGSREEKEIFLNTIINNGGEGVVFHNRLGSYCTSENRSKTSFIKLKRTVTATNNKEGMGDTVDGFVTGFKLGSNGTANEGLISALAFSIYVNDNGKIYRHTIAICPNIDLSTKRMCTIPDASGLYPQEWIDSNGESHWVSLNPDFDGLVGELTGQSLSSVSQRITHSALVRWRTERSPESCIYTKEWLDSQTDNVGVTYEPSDL